jgi:hypothetical protein
MFGQISGATGVGQPFFLSVTATFLPVPKALAGFLVLKFVYTVHSS